MNFRSTVLGAILAISSTYVNAQTGLQLPMVSNFQRIKVTQESIFQGSVFFSEGLNLKGAADFLNSVKITEDLTVQRGVKFAGLQELDQFNTLIGSDQIGNLTRVPLDALSTAVVKQGLPPLNDLHVTGATLLDGDLTLGGQSRIRGHVNLLDGLVSNGPAQFSGGVQLTELEQIDANTRVSVLGVSPEGQIISLNLTQLGIDPVFELDPCATNTSQTPAAWRYGPNTITTDRCSNNIKVGLGTQTPRERLEVNGKVLVTDGIYAGRKSGAFAANHELLGKLVVGGRVGQTDDRDVVTLGFDGNHCIIESSHAERRPLLINYLSGDNVVIGNREAQTNLEVAGTLAVGTSEREAAFQVDPQSNTRAILVGTNGDKKFVVTNTGNVFAKEVNVKLSGFPDYVFEKNYRLPSLQEIEHHIEQYGRLPKMPSAKQVEKDGADLGELVRLLVEKNEELTLHLIRMQKEIDELKKIK